CRYDRDIGTWEYFTELDVLPSDRALCLLDDGSYMWAGCAEGGVVRYLRSTGTWKIVGDGRGESPTSCSFIESSDGRLLVAGAAGGLYSYDIARDLWAELPGADARLGCPASDTLGTLVSRWGGGVYDLVTGGAAIGLARELPSPWTSAMASSGDTLAVALDASGVAISLRNGMLIEHLPPPCPHSVIGLEWNDSALLATCMDGSRWRAGADHRDPWSMESGPAATTLPWWRSGSTGFALVTGEAGLSEPWRGRIWVVERGNHLWSVSSDLEWAYHGRLAPTAAGRASSMDVIGGSLVCASDAGWIALIDSSYTLSLFQGPPGCLCLSDGERMLYCVGGAVLEAPGPVRPVASDTVALIRQDGRIVDAIAANGSLFAVDSDGRVWRGPGEMVPVRGAGVDVDRLWLVGDSLVLCSGDSGVRWLDIRDGSDGYWRSPEGPGVPDLQDAYISRVEEAGGFVWLLTGWGTFRWSPSEGSWRAFMPFDGLTTGFYDDIASCGAILLLASDGVGLDMLLPDGSPAGYGFTESGLALLPSLDVLSLASTDDLALIGTGSGVVLYRPGDGSWFRVTELPVCACPAEDRTFSSIDVADGMVAVASSDEVRMLDLETGEWRTRAPWGEGAAVSGLCFSDDYLWVSLVRGAVFALNLAGDFWFSYGSGTSLPEGSVRAISSREGHVWAATAGGAATAELERFRTPGWTWHTGRQRAARRAVSSAMAADLRNSNLLDIASLGRDAMVLSSTTLERFDAGAGTWSTLLELPRYLASCLSAEAVDAGWVVGLADGRVILGGPGPSADTMRVEGRVSCILLRGGHVFAGSPSGLFIDGSRIEPPPLRAPGSPTAVPVEDIAFDGERIWVAGSMGVLSYSPETARWQLWSGPP
ncbi:hypothetical protein JW921_02865, partial [Candidatus Fermentibacterales bacterium]|nr:hypothetical protein [Candidatus Fermentibacterales bacterium]